MNIQKIYLLVVLFIVCIFSISTINASEDIANKDIASEDIISVDNNENNFETNICYEADVSNNEENSEHNLEQSNNNEEKKSTTDNTKNSNVVKLTFSDLNQAINGNNNSTVYLSKIYNFNDDTDSGFINGIDINRDLTIYGNGTIIDGKHTAIIYDVASACNVKFYNINFLNGYSAQGGAINGGNSYNCNFRENVATVDGGAIYQGNAYNCTFTNNHAYEGDGGAIYEGNAYNCTLTGNTATNGGAIFSGEAYNCIFTNNTATLGGGIYGANGYNCTFKGNYAYLYGAGLYGANGYNCTFIDNIAESGGALAYGNAINSTFKGNIGGTGYPVEMLAGPQSMYEGNAILCKFDGDKYGATIIPATINVLNYTSTYGSGEKLLFNVTANDELYDGLNVTIKIYKDDSLVKTVYGLSGEGWVVDLVSGEYDAVLSLTDYPDEPSSNVSINVK